MNLTSRISALALASALAVGLFGAPATASSTVVALWHMDEPAGATTMLDSSGNGLNGTLTDVVAGVPGDPSIPGSTAYRFNGSSSVVTVPDSPLIDPGTADFSFTVHVRIAEIPNSGLDYDVVRKGDSSRTAGDYKLEVFGKTVNHVLVARPSCRFHGFVNGTKVGKIIERGSIGDGNWHTVTCARAGGSIKLTIDGVTYSKNVTLGSITNSSTLLLGAKKGGDYLDGDLDEVSISVG